MTVGAPTDLPGLNIYKPKVEDYRMKMLIYGSPGVGKTSLLATANLHPLTAPILIVNVEGGTLSISETSTLGLAEPPDVVDLTSYDQLNDIFWYLAKGDHPYKSVGIDSLSELQTVNLESVVRKQMSKTSGGGSRRESMDDVWLEDYGTSNNQLRRMLRQFRDLPMHVFFTCHDASSQDKDKNEVVHPALTPGLRTAVLGYMDIVGYLYNQAVTDEDGNEATLRRMLSRPYGKWLAKDRSPGQRLGLSVDNPSIPIIMDRITKKGE